MPNRNGFGPAGSTARVAVRERPATRFDVDWVGLGFSDDELDEFAEHLLRIIQSFVIDPGRPPRAGKDLRDYLRRWVGGAVLPSRKGVDGS